MKQFSRLSVILFLLCTVLFTSCNKQKVDNDYMIRVETPERPAGQTDLVGFAVEPIETVRIGIIGLGMRGYGAIERLIHIPGAKIQAICDLHQNRVDKVVDFLNKNNYGEVATYAGSRDAWKALCERDDIDLVYVVTDWQTHAPMSIYAMEQGKHVACEVPAVMNMQEIWDVINTAERTKKHCMQLENCVYDFFELTTLNMAQQGVFGELIHVEGAYIHCLEPYWDAYENDWRLTYNQHNRGDVYPTHGMGPACQLLNIHRGDKMNYLVAVDTKPLAIPAFIEKTRGTKPDNFQNGDHTLTLIKTEKEKTIHIQHNVSTPRPYNRMYQLTGAKGFANKYPIEGYALEGGSVDQVDGMPDIEQLDAHSFVSDEMRNALMQQYKHPIHRELEEKAKEVGGHGGMDYIMDYRLIYCLRNGLPLDMDVYDLAEWCCLIPLTKLSIENNSAPVEIPDFTRGAWNKLDKIEFAFAK